MNRLTVCVVIGLFVGSAVCSAQTTIAYTSFEEPVVSGFFYTDTLDPATDHELINNSGEPPVQYTGVDGELGFQSFYTNSLDSVGLINKLVGVTDAPGFAQMPGPNDGTQRYFVSDIDGRLTVVLDTVDLSGTIAPEASIEFQVRSSGWDWNDNGRFDYFRAWVEVDDGFGITEYTLIDSRGSRLDDSIGENVSASYSTSLPNDGIATFKFEGEMTETQDMLAVDVILFTDVPEPASLVLMGVCSLLLARRR